VDAEFEIDLEARKATHVQTGTVFSFYLYPDPADWVQAHAQMAKLTDLSPRGAALITLAGMAKDAAVAAGMKGQREGG
jgi:hypothetical protein